ncbi:hypothetical protein N7448_009394 [Penicillium atrosanguineum]|uniref:Cyclin N-terminal domain-containing protein n=1 Tax=Penicillium atrosanguineum TaxID=1132637 RepID=A0A9W9Q096_9EURO|nr:Armadillo-like helical [Penicillium atrosanguineum]KAJ5123297.1 hypothetical protein N7448_009394 [Penicillium atrosanguineum]KAJ5141929.1 hypothetical protein N7526_002924 [Penicillium atrosanguineum]KAJ5298526.1 Armadillo-like helical [Penicillium atrosanguineum]KAJ5321210.1 hypothetical protein N7476_004212 [Penicillium atrosanguineum]
MDAKPQRIRVRGDENMPPTTFQAGKTIHQRNKSTPALSAMALSAKNGARRAFGDVSNTKDVNRASRDDLALGKPATKQDVKPVLSQPAQRPMSMSGLKGVLNTVTAKPSNPAGKAQPTVKSNNKRNNVIFRDQLEPVVEKPTTKETATVKESSKENIYEEWRRDLARTETAPTQIDADKVAWMEEQNLKEEAAREAYLDQGRTSPIYSDTTISDTEESKEDLKDEVKIDLKNVAEVTPEPEVEVEEWEDAEEDHAPAFHSRTENTTGGSTTIIYPKITAITKREMLRAKEMVESARTEEDILEDFYDSSMVAEYSSEIFLHLRTKEISMLPTADYMTNQAEIQWSMRSVLMDWLVQVHFRFALLPETLFLCVNYIDRFLSRKIVSLGKLQLVGATAIFIAAKYEEITAPSVQEIVYMVDGGYTVDEILKAERFMLTILNFDLGWPGPMSFLRRISKADDYDLETRTVAKYFLELTIMDERFVSTPPSFASAGAHCLARQVLGKGYWTPAHAFYSGYLYEQLIPVMTTMMECCEDPQRHHQAIFEKYSDRRFKRASLYVEAEMKRGFKLLPMVSLKDVDRLEGFANY